jgi:hypothetical protein
MDALPSHGLVARMVLVVALAKSMKTTTRVSPLVQMILLWLA